MASLPKYPFRVTVRSKLQGTHLHQENHNFEMLASALEYRNATLRDPRTYSVEVVAVLDLSFPKQKSGNPLREHRERTVEPQYGSA